MTNSKMLGLAVPAIVSQVSAVFAKIRVGRLNRGCLFSSLLLALIAAAGMDNAAAASPEWPYASKDGNFELWLPGDSPLIKGVLIFPFHGVGEKVLSQHPPLRTMAGEIHCAIVRFNNKGKLSNGSEVGFPGCSKWPPSVLLEALSELAQLSGHPEVAHAPLLLFGHSNATPFLGGFAEKDPGRVFGWIAFNSGYPAQFNCPALYQIPGMAISGETDELYFQDNVAVVERLRAEKHALTHMIIDPGRGHWGDANTFTILTAFIRTVFQLRVPADADARTGPVKLIELQESQGWLGKNVEGTRIRLPNFTWKWEKPVDVRQLLEIAPFAEFTGDKTRASWLPNADYARKWQEFCHTGVVGSGGAAASAVPKTVAPPENHLTPLPITGQPGKPVVLLEAEPLPAAVPQEYGMVFLGGVVVKHSAERVDVSRSAVIPFKPGHAESSLTLRYALDERVQPGKYAVSAAFTLGAVATQKFTFRAGADPEHLQPRLAFDLQNTAAWKLAWQQGVGTLQLDKEDRILEIDIQGMATERKILDAFLLIPAELLDTRGDTK
ncbi:MAG: hypothetical protein WAX69_23470 [Victivallales bacterium]